MDSIIALIIAIVIFAVVAIGMKWVITEFQLPQPVMLICGAMLLIIILLAVARFLDGGAGSFAIKFP